MSDLKLLKLNKHIEVEQILSLHPIAKTLKNAYVYFLFRNMKHKVTITSRKLEYFLKIIAL